MALTFESVDEIEILWSDHSNETSLPVLSHGATCFSKFYKIKTWDSFAVKGLKGSGESSRKYPTLPSSIWLYLDVH